MCKKNTALKTAIDAYSFLAKETLSDLVGEHTSSLTINFD